MSPYHKLVRAVESFLAEQRDHVGEVADELRELESAVRVCRRRERIGGERLVIENFLSEGEPT